MPSVGTAVPRVAVSLTQCWHRVPGGTATSVVQLVDALAGRDDVEVVVVGARGATGDTATVPEGVELRRSALPVSALYDAWDLVGRPRLDAVGAVPGAPIDLVHLTVPMGPPRSSTPLVATVHDLFPLSRPEWFTRRGARLMGRSLRRISRRADLVLVPSEAVAEDCRAHGFDPHRVRVVPWGSTPVRIAPERVEEARARRGIDGPYVLFVGTVEPRKGLPVLADAMARVGRADVTLVVAGPAGWGTAADRHLAAVPGPVLRTGWIPTGELDALRAGASVCCLPSWAEGFGLPALEALAAGAPLVTSAGTASAEVAGDAALLVPPGRADLLADAIRTVLDDVDLAASLRAAGPLRAAGFRWSDTAAAVLDAYRWVLS